jgi:HSP20 family protein
MTLLKQADRPSISRRSWLTDFFDDDDFFVPFGRRNLPAANVKETDKSFELEIAVPGFNKKDFNISVHNKCLTISAEKEEESNQDKDNYTRREFGYQSISRSFNLPENVNEESIDAHYNEGVLKLLIEKNTQVENKLKKPIVVK